MLLEECLDIGAGGSRLEKNRKSGRIAIVVKRRGGTEIVVDEKNILDGIGAFYFGVDEWRKDNRVVVQVIQNISVWHFILFSNIFKFKF